MAYEVTKDLETGNTLIDSEHRQLFQAINNLLDACSQGKGRTQIQSTIQFLNSYVGKHFSDEERLQVESKYPDYPAHKRFHEGYKQKMAQVTNELAANGVNISSVGKVNEAAGILVTHIRTEDKRLAQHVKSAK
jgi:hemerythrin